MDLSFGRSDVLLNIKHSMNYILCMTNVWHVDEEDKQFMEIDMRNYLWR